MRMKKILVPVSMYMLAAVSCQPAPEPLHTSMDTGLQQTPLVTDTQPADTLLHMDSSVMVVDSTSHITFNGMPVKGDRNDIHRAVYNSWLHAYDQSGHLPVGFQLVQQGTVTMGIRGILGDAVLQAQEDMKSYVAKDKYNQTFSALPAGEKDSLQKLHPILFKRPF